MDKEKTNFGNGFFSIDELKKIGFRSVGNNANVSRKASIYGAGYIDIGDNVRIDDFCIGTGRCASDLTAYNTRFCLYTLRDTFQLVRLVIG